MAQAESLVSYLLTVGLGEAPPSTLAPVNVKWG